MSAMTIAKSELILGGQKSGKSRRAELLARQWLAQSPQHQAVLIATAQPWDDEMRERIARHQQDRAARVPGMATVEEPLQLAQAITQHSSGNTLVVVDCLTLWLTNLLMPAESFKENKPAAQEVHGQVAMLLIAIAPPRDARGHDPTQLHTGPGRRPDTGAGPSGRPTIAAARARQNR